MIIDSDWLCRRAFGAAQFEACGFIMSDGEIIELPNVAKNNTSSFEMSQIHLESILDGREDQIVAIWHTHPSGSLELSELDLKAIRIGAIWPNWKYIIATKTEVREYDTETLRYQDDICI